VLVGRIGQRDLARRVLPQPRREVLPELVLDVLERVDAEAVDAVAVDPVVVDVDESLQHARVFGHQVIEAAEIPERGILAPESRIAAIVVVDRIVQPRRHLDVLFAFRHVRRVRKVGTLQQREVGGVLVFGRMPRKTDVDGFPAAASAARVRIVGERAIRAVVPGALAIPNDVGGVIDDDVEVELHAARVRRIDQ